MLFPSCLGTETPIFPFLTECQTSSVWHCQGINKGSCNSLCIGPMGQHARSPYHTPKKDTFKKRQLKSWFSSFNTTWRQVSFPPLHECSVFHYINPLLVSRQPVPIFSFCGIVCICSTAVFWGDFLALGENVLISHLPLPWHLHRVWEGGTFSCHLKGPAAGTQGSYTKQVFSSLSFFFLWFSFLFSSFLFVVRERLMNAFKF